MFKRLVIIAYNSITLPGALSLFALVGRTRIRQSQPHHLYKLFTHKYFCLANFLHFLSLAAEQIEEEKAEVKKLSYYF